MDDDAALAQILAANDDLMLAVNAYKDVMTRGEHNGGRTRSKSEEVTCKNISKPSFAPCREKHADLWSVVCLILFSLLCSAPTSPREIKSYHLIDLSALDSPQTQRKANPQPVFESSSPLLSSHSESFFFSEAEQVSGEPASIIFSVLLLINISHHIIMLCFTEFDDLDSKQTHQTQKSYYEELMQVRFLSYG